MKSIAHALVGVLLALLAGAPRAWAGGAPGDEPPRLPCEGAPLPAYAEPGQPPAVQVWRHRAAHDWVPPACSGWTGKGFEIVVAVSGSFKHEGEIDELLNRIGAISARTKVHYWSTTEKTWILGITEAFALSGPDVALRRADFSAAQFAKGQTLYCALSDNRSSGKTVYRDRVLALDREQLHIAHDNYAPMKMMLLTLFEPGGLQTTYFIARRAPGVWSFYSLTRARVASSVLPLGPEASYINRAVAFFRLVAGIPSDQEPPAAR
ncbi:MAG TPA: hypothetical protein PKB14_18410 [Rubrivivax sp.]|nr:hypothetical protein [Rubrivivax sp.]